MVIYNEMFYSYYYVIFLELIFLLKYLYTFPILN